MLGLSFKDYPHLKRFSHLKNLEAAIDFKKAQEEQISAIQSLSPDDQRELLEASQQRAPFKLGYKDNKEGVAYYTLLEEKITKTLVSGSEQTIESETTNRSGGRRSGEIFRPVMRSEGRKSSPLLEAKRPDAVSDYPELFKYFDYLRQAQAINPQTLLKEKELLENEIYASLIHSENEKRLAGQCSIDEDADDSAVYRIGCLTRAVGIEVAQAHDWKPVHAVVHQTVLLGGQLRHRVRTHGPNAIAFRLGNLRWAPVDGCRGCVHKTTHLAFGRQPQQTESRASVDVEIDHRFFDRACEAPHRGVHDTIGARDELLHQSLVSNVSFMKFKSRMSLEVADVSAETLAEVVNA